MGVGVVPIQWPVRGTRFFNASLLPDYTTAPLPVLKTFSAAHAMLQRDYTKHEHVRSAWCHTSFGPPQTITANPLLVTPFSAASATADMIEPPRKRQKTGKTMRRKDEGGVENSPELKAIDEEEEDVANNPLMRTYKIKMLPTPDQRRELKKIFDVCRIAYNWANTRVGERVRLDGLSVMQAANFIAIRNEWTRDVGDTYPCTKGIVKTYACGAIEQLTTAYTINEKRRKKKPMHTYEIGNRDLLLSSAETIKVEGDRKANNYAKKTSPLSRFAPSPYNSHRKPECLAFLGGNLATTGGIRLRDSQRVIDRLLSDGDRLMFTSLIQWDKRTNTFFFLYVFELPKLEDPDPTFAHKRVVSTDPGSNPFQHWYSPTSGRHGELLSGKSGGPQLVKRLNSIRARERELKMRSERPKRCIRSRKWCQRTRRLQRKLAQIRVCQHNWMRCAHYDAANFLLRHYHIVIQPWLKVAGMVRYGEGGLSAAGKRKMTGWSHHKFRVRLLSASARYKGRHVIVSEEPGTSKTCTQCGYWNADLALGDKVYDCPQCGVCVDRQLAGARNNFFAAYGCAKRMWWDGTH